MKSGSSKQGFGLVEAMIGIVATTILALTMGSMLYFGWLSWSRNSQSVEMQRDASLAMRIISKEVHNSTNVTINGSTLECSSPSNTVRFVKNGSNLEMEVDGTVQMNLIRDVLDVFAPASTNYDGVVVDIGLSVNGDIVAVSETVYPRN